MNPEQTYLVLFSDGDYSEGDNWEYVISSAVSKKDMLEEHYGVNFFDSEYITVYNVTNSNSQTFQVEDKPTLKEIEV